jgi:hypothetical protein
MRYVGVGERRSHTCQRGGSKPAAQRER